MGTGNTNIKGKDILTGGSKIVIETPLIIQSKDDDLSLPVTTSDEIATEIQDNDGIVTYTSLTEAINTINTTLKNVSNVTNNATKDGADGFLRYKLVQGSTPDSTTMKNDILYIFTD